MVKSRESKTYLLLHKSNCFMCKFSFEYYSLCKKLYLEKMFVNFKVLVIFQEFTNLRCSKGFGFHFSKLQRAGHSFTCSFTFSLALLERPHLHNLHWKASFLYFSTFPFFLLRIPKSSIGSTSTTENPIVNGMYLELIFFWKILESRGNFNKIIEPLAAFFLITRPVRGGSENSVCVKDFLIASDFKQT